MVFIPVPTFGELLSLVGTLATGLAELKRQIENNFAYDREVADALERFEKQCGIYKLLLHLRQDNRHAKEVSSRMSEEKEYTLLRELQNALNVADADIVIANKEVVSRSQASGMKAVTGALSRLTGLPGSSALVTSRRITEMDHTLRLAFEAYNSAFEHYEHELLMEALSPPDTPSSIRSSLTATPSTFKTILASAFERTPFNINAVKLDEADIKKLFETYTSVDSILTCLDDATSLGSSWSKSNMRNELASSQMCQGVLSLDRVHVRLFFHLQSSLLRFQAANKVTKLVHDLIDTVEVSLSSSTEEPVTIAVLGNAKAGKSMFLNCLMELDLLPSGAAVETAVPTRLRHQDRNDPVLRYDREEYQHRLEVLQRENFPAKLAAYKLRAAEAERQRLATIFSNDDLAPETQEEKDWRHRLMYWSGLQDHTKSRLDKQWSFPAGGTIEGVERIVSVLEMVNDVARLCRCFSVGINGLEDWTLDEKNWPLIDVRIRSTGSLTSTDNVEFIDLPGLGEVYDESNFIPMVTKVIQRSPIVIPVVSLKEVDSNPTWRHLPELVKSGLGTRASVIVCTHLDQVRGYSKSSPAAEVGRIAGLIAKAFWDDERRVSDVLPCSPPNALFSKLWVNQTTDADKPEVDFQSESFAVRHLDRVLGVDAEDEFRRLTPKEFKAKLNRSIEKSAFPSVSRRLGNLVGNARLAVLQNWLSLVKGGMTSVLSQQTNRFTLARANAATLHKYEIDLERVRSSFATTRKTWDAGRSRREHDAENRLADLKAAFDSKADTQLIEIISQELTRGEEYHLLEFVKVDSTNYEKFNFNKAPSPSQTFIRFSRDRGDQFLERCFSRLHLDLAEEHLKWQSALPNVAASMSAEWTSAFKKLFLEDLPREANVRLTRVNDFADFDFSADLRVLTGAHRLRTRYNPGTAARGVDKWIGTRFGLFDSKVPNWLWRVPVSPLTGLATFLSSPIWIWMKKDNGILIGRGELKEQLTQHIVRTLSTGFHAEALKWMQSLQKTHTLDLYKMVEEDLDRRAAQIRASLNDPNRASPTKLAEIVTDLVNTQASMAALIELEDVAASLLSPLTPSLSPSALPQLMDPAPA